MTHQNDAWNWLDTTPPYRHDTDHSNLDLRRAFARLLAYPESEIVFQHLHSITRNRVLGPDASAATLRYVEGQKAIVAYMERMAANGQNPPR